MIKAITDRRKKSKNGKEHVNKRERGFGMSFGSLTEDIQG